MLVIFKICLLIISTFQTIAFTHFHVKRSTISANLFFETSKRFLSSVKGTLSNSFILNANDLSDSDYYFRYKIGVFTFLPRMFVQVASCIVCNCSKSSHDILIFIDIQPLCCLSFHKCVSMSVKTNHISGLNSTDKPNILFNFFCIYVGCPNSK